MATPTKLELLSPAKNLECGIEAINHGADAVYIGASRFGARAMAGNSTDDIAKLCQYAHQFDAKVYVTVNTIIYNEELSATISLIKDLQEIGVDAILVQDMGLYSILSNKRNSLSGEENDLSAEAISAISSMPSLHASTQTDNRTVEKVKWLASIGFKRVVLARELSIEEIREIHEAVPEVELEVFVHGALCVSYSGQCYASQHCFNRSANRGECAQFCRMAFTLRDASGETLEQSRHLLSLKDMAQLDNLERLALAGAMSFKIEGRLKDVDYVKNVTAAYSERLNEICRRHPDRFQRASMGKCNYTFKPDIKKSFNRGFTTYFADNKPSTERDSLVSFDTPKAIGEPVGRVKELRGNSFNVSSMAAFSNGDGLCFFDSDRKLIGFRVNKAEGNRLFPLTMPRELRPGTMLFRNYDHAFQTLLSKNSAERKMGVSMLLKVTKDRLTLIMTNEHGDTYTASEQYDYQLAQKPQDENINRQLSKLGSTPFVCQDITIESEVEQPFIPSSTLSRLRQNATQSECRRNSSGISAKPGRKTNSIAPQYQHSYLHNAANDEAKAFYKSQGISATAFEKDGNSGETLLMQCRYCLRAELGYCTKSGRKAPWREPLTITLDDGKTFRLKFNCAKCQMEIVTDTK